MKDKLLNIALIAAGVYVAWRLLPKIFSGAGAALTATGERIGSSIFDWAHRNDYMPTTYSRRNGASVVTQVTSIGTGQVFDVRRDGTILGIGKVGAPRAEAGT